MSLCLRCPSLSVLLFLLVTSSLILASEPAWADAGASDELSGDESSPFSLSDDPDIQLADTYFWLHLGSNAATTGFGVGALVGGVENFIVAQGLGQAGGQPLFLGLTLVSLGAASIVNGVTAIEYSVRSWKAQKRALSLGRATQRRLLREREIRRLRRRVKSHAMAIAADGTFLGIGIALMVLNPSSLSTPLIVNGAFILGLDIFQLVVDDQAARKWEARNEADSAGYFGRSSTRRGPKILAVGASPWLSPPSVGASKREPGMIFSLAGVY
ncbi:MAG: hypothetical protein VX498_05700 [Myxococcota bacterium]|nr:hypothetical protein [Myxococcota bacterium]